MSALTAERYQTRRDGDFFDDPVAAGAKIWAGALVALDAAGDAQPGETATGLIARGIAQATVDNTAGLAGDLTVRTRRGLFRLANSGGADEITKAENGDVAYMVDDQTVAKTSAGGTRSIAGVIEDVDTAGVWVWVGYHPGQVPGGLAPGNNLSDVNSPQTARANLGANKVFLQVQAVDLVGANTAVYRVVAPIAGDITAIRSVLSDALTTGDATITAAINGTPVTGGVVTITQAASAAGDVDSAAPSAANTVAVGDVITFTVGGTNDATETADLVFEITH